MRLYAGRRHEESFDVLRTSGHWIVRKIPENSGASFDPGTLKRLKSPVFGK